MATDFVPKKRTTVYKISLMIFVLITLSALMSIRNFPTMGLMNWQLLFFGFLAILMFLVPASLVSAELATGWPQTGEVYVWVKQAFGQKWGFLSVSKKEPYRPSKPTIRMWSPARKSFTSKQSK